MRVHIAQVVKSQIGIWSRQEGKEIGGILLGCVQRRGDFVQRVRVEAAILAQKADSVGSSIRLTPALVADLTRQAEAEYPTFEVVGWFHTHNGLGAFLSSYDIGVHKTNFPWPWQISLVSDPVLKEEAIYVYDDEGELLPYQGGPSRHHYELIPTGLPGSRYRLVNPKRLLASLALLVLLAAAGTGLWRWLKEPSEPAGGDQLTELSGLPDDEQPGLPDPLPPSPEPALESTADYPAEEIVHIVEPNDTLWGISERYYGRGSYYGYILDYNQIDNARKLVPGQMLLLPPLADRLGWDVPGVNGEAGE